MGLPAGMAPGHWEAQGKGGRLAGPASLTRECVNQAPQPRLQEGKRLDIRASSEALVHVRQGDAWTWG